MFLFPNLFTHIVIGIFLFLIAVKIAQYLFQVYEFNSSWIRIPLPTLLFLSAGIFGISGFLLLFFEPADTLLAVALAIGVTLSFLHPVAAVSFMVSNLLIRPWETFKSNSTLAVFPRLLAAVAILSWISSRFVQRKLTFVWNRWLTIFTLIFIWLIISALISPFSDENFDFIFKIFLPTYVVCVFLVNSVETQRDLDLLKSTVTLALTAVVAGAITITVFHPEYRSGGMRLQGVIGLNGNSNDLAAFSVLASPFAIISLLRAWDKKRISWIDIFCLAILLIGLLMTKSRAGVMALGASFLLYMFMTTKSIIRLILRLSMLVPFLLIFVTVAMQRSKDDLEGSSDSRFNYIVSGFRMLRDHPIFGVGVNNYPRFYERYTMSYLETGARTAHSTWMLLLAESGFIGLILFSVLFFKMVGKAWKMRTGSPEWIMASLGYGITMTVLSHCYTIYPYLLIFMILSASRVAQKEEKL